MADLFEKAEKVEAALEKSLKWLKYFSCVNRDGVRVATRVYVDDQGQRTVYKKVLGVDDDYSLVI